MDVRGQNIEWVERGRRWKNGKRSRQNASVSRSCTKVYFWAIFCDTSSEGRERGTGLLPGHLFSSGEMAGGRSKISSAPYRLALEIPLDLYCVVFTNIIEHTWDWVQLPIINTLCQYRLTFQSVIFKIYSITRNSPTLKLNYPSGLIFFQIFLKGQLDKYLNYTVRNESLLSKALCIFKIGTYLSSIKCPGFVWEATPVEGVVAWFYFLDTP